MAISDFGMRNSELLEKLNSFLSSFIPQSIHRISNLFSHVIPQSALRIPHFSIGQQKVLFALSLIILVLLYFKFYYHSPSPPEEVYQEGVVEVLGEVKNPGISIFKNPPTLKEAIEKAGGLKENALFDQGPSSEILETGTQLHVLKESPIIPPSPPLVKGGVGGFKQDMIKIKLGRMEARKLFVFSIPLDLNRVSVKDLCLIPGIGESLAREIVAYRKKRRRYRSVEELKNVKGIGEKTYQSFKTFFTVKP